LTTATASQIQHVTPTDFFKVEPFTPHCEVIRAAGDHAVIGVSPGNSYFSARRVHDLALWGLALFERVDFVYTDLYVAEMYEASGYPPDDARRKAVKNLRGVRAKVLGAVQDVDPGGTRHRPRPQTRRDRPGGAAGADAAPAAGRTDRAVGVADRIHEADSGTTAGDVVTTVLSAS
jgi:hypothetical protein